MKYSKRSVNSIFSRSKPANELRGFSRGQEQINFRKPRRLVAGFLKEYFWIILFAIFIIGSLSLSYDPGIKIYSNFSQFFLEMITFLPLMFLLVGLFDVWIPKEKIERHIGRESGLAGIFWVVLLAMVQAGPLYSAFPVAHLLSSKGASVRNIFIYLGTFSALKIPMLTFEIGFLGLKFTLLRTLFTLPIFIIIGIIMEKYLGREYKVLSGKNQ